VLETLHGLEMDLAGYRGPLVIGTLLSSGSSGRVDLVKLDRRSESDEGHTRKRFQGA